MRIDDFLRFLLLTDDHKREFEAFLHRFAMNLAREVRKADVARVGVHSKNAIAEARRRGKKVLEKKGDNTPDNIIRKPVQYSSKN